MRRAVGTSGEIPIEKFIGPRVERLGPVPADLREGSPILIMRDERLIARSPEEESRAGREPPAWEVYDALTPQTDESANFSQASSFT